MANQFILVYQCDDRPGVVAAVTTHFASRGFNLLESSQFQDPRTGRFFMRTEYADSNGAGIPLRTVRSEFRELADRYSMDWEIVDKGRPMRALIAVSRLGHCLNQLLNVSKHRSVPIEIVGVVSNHADLRALCDWYEVEFHHLPVTPRSRPGQERQLLEHFERLRAEVMVLARYMQILSDETCRVLDGRAINIHHSFLPGFKGARPYHQAYDKGVKLIGATAHYVTSDLDEGPIIEQAVMRVSHAYQPSELAETGRDVESTVLTRAVKWHAERRVVINGEKTVVFAQ